MRFVAGIVLVTLISALFAQEIALYTDTRYVEGADDTLGFVLELRLLPNGRVSGGELRLYEGPPEPTVRLQLEVRTRGRRVVLQGKHDERGLFTVAGTRSDSEFRGTVKEADNPPVSVRLRRESN